MDQALTVRDVALLLRVDEKTVYRLVRKGDMPAFKVAGAWRFRRADMEAWVERQKSVARAGTKLTARGRKRETH